MPPADEADHDDANPDPGTGASGPGEAGYDGDAQVNVAGGEAEIDLEAKRRAIEVDRGADPGRAASP